MLSMLCGAVLFIYMSRRVSVPPFRDIEIKCIAVNDRKCNISGSVYAFNDTIVSFYID
jgi:hypothetical protein